MSTNPYDSPRSDPFSSSQGGSSPRPGSGLAIAGFVIGLAELVGWCLPLVGLPLGITGLVLSCKGLGSANRGLAIAGIALNSIGLLLTLANAAFGAYLAATGQHPLVPR